MLSAAQRESLETRFARRLTARLDADAMAVPHDIGERLRVARQQSVAAARHARLAALVSGAPAPVTAPGVTVVGVDAQGSAVIGGWSGSGGHSSSHQTRRGPEPRAAMGWRLASILPVMALVAGLWAVHHYGNMEKIQAAAEIDTALLTDELPPSAYADPGFAEYLRSDARGPVRPMDPAAADVGGDLKTTETQAAQDTP